MSAIGLVAGDGGPFSLRPRAEPEITRMCLVLPVCHHEHCAGFEKKMTKVPRIMLFGVETGWTFQCHSGLHTTGTAPRAGWLST
ncbi:MAG: hypothetical protein M3490_10830, partial [Chloroflexota bacterium]|nr:hypothetical protein [Chloroflexota bacterium]